MNSDVFTIGGYKWMIEYYPDGYTTDDKKFISFFLNFERKHTEVNAQFSFTILQNGAPSDFCLKADLSTFNSTDYWGCDKFARRTEFEQSECLKDDSFTLECTVTVVKGHLLKAISHSGIIIPPSNLIHNWANLLESGKGADVTFVVKGEEFKAHRCVLAARSAFFNAQLLGCMKEKWTDTITVDDIEPPLFKSMLYFIYADALPDFERTSVDDGEKQDLKLMVPCLLVAADRYQLERLRLMCENVLSKNLCVSNAVTTLLLAERHNCSELKAQCLRFISAPEVFKAVALTDEFPNLMKICPSILKDI